MDGMTFPTPGTAAQDSHSSKEDTVCAGTLEKWERLCFVQTHSQARPSSLAAPASFSWGCLLLRGPKGTAKETRQALTAKTPRPKIQNPSLSKSGFGHARSLGPGRTHEEQAFGWGAGLRSCEMPTMLPGLGIGSRSPWQHRESQATGSWQEGRVSSDMCSLKLAAATSWPRAQVSLSQPLTAHQPACPPLGWSLEGGGSSWAAQKPERSNAPDSQR